jgi:hypothetical protein
MDAAELDAFYVSVGVCGWFPLGIFFMMHVFKGEFQDQADKCWKLMLE